MLTRDLLGRHVAELLDLDTLAERLAPELLSSTSAALTPAAVTDMLAQNPDRPWGHAVTASLHWALRTEAVSEAVSAELAEAMDKLVGNGHA